MTSATTKVRILSGVFLLLAFAGMLQAGTPGPAVPAAGVSAGRNAPAGDEKGAAPKPEGIPAASAARTGEAAAAISPAEAFALLKSLAGEWQGTMGESGGSATGRVSYKVIAAGSAVAESLLPGTPHEMIDVYHMDGDRLMMTHYCAAGNQPRLALTKESTPACLVFDFIGATNMKSDRDEHMHTLRVRVADADHIQSEWDGYKDGRKTHTAVFILTRVK